jgi:glycosyltransferase involved in cell wall biosynthesis
LSQAIFLSLIIPAYNEEQRLPDALGRIAAFLEAQNYLGEVIVVENGSNDRTYLIAEGFSKDHPNFNFIHSDERGKGLAVKKGMLAARGEYRMMLDADLSMPVDQINRFLPPQLEGADVVIASREAPGAVRYNEPDYRHIGGRIVNLLIRLLAIPDLQDTQCGFKCFRADVAEDLFRKQTLEGWSFDVELLYIAGLRGYNIVELPIPWYYSDLSHVDPIRDSVRLFFDLLAIRRNALRGLYGSAN